MNTCNLHLLSWASINGVVRPICPAHPEAEVHAEPTIDKKGVMVSCAQNHTLNMCSAEEFEAEKQEAMALLSRYS
jgi:hypothetical protein